MRSYYAHLATTAAPSQGAVPQKPVFRSSAIFPVMHLSGLSSRILFMGYWILKRNIREIAAIATLRNNDGTFLTRHAFTILEAKTFRIEVGDLLKMSNQNHEQEFYGSLEIEFFSTQNLVFPFPAVVINYYSPQFSTVVHTAQRIYNDFEDMAKNSQTHVAESGFNIYADGDREPFIGLINGILPVEHSLMKLQFFNNKGETLECELELGRIKPYETKWIYPARTCGIQEFLSGCSGTCKVHFDVNWIFPRLLVGNIHHRIPAVTITHTYYDCSLANSPSDYWQSENPDFYPAALMVPAAIADDHFTNVYFYPIYSPSSFAIDAEIYNEQGNLLAFKKNVLSLSSFDPQFHRLSLQELYKELNLSKADHGGLRLIAHSLDDTPIPARIKLGLDVGINGFTTPCNICTNLQPYNPALDGKPSSFRWAPILADNEAAAIWIMNSSPAKKCHLPATVEITFFREIDASTIQRTLSLPANGFVALHIHRDPELKAFFNRQIGWMTAITTTPYTTMYYFAEGASGVVGGDHGF